MGPSLCPGGVILTGKHREGNEERRGKSGWSADPIDVVTLHPSHPLTQGW